MKDELYSAIIIFLVIVIAFTGMNSHRNKQEAKSLELKVINLQDEIEAYKLYSNRLHETLNYTLDTLDLTRDSLNWERERVVFLNNNVARFTGRTDGLIK